MERKSLLSFIMAPILCMGIIAGCSGGSGNGGSSDGTANKAATDSAGKANTQAAKPTLKILRGYWNVDLNKDPMKQVVEDLTGYKTEWYLLPQNNPDEKLLIELSSGADYDIVMLGSKSIISKLAAQGALTELGPLLDKLGPNIKKGYAPESLQQMTFGKKLFAIPTNKNIPFVLTNVIVREDMLKELNVKAPETLDEFTSMLRVVKEKKGIIPLTGTGSFYDSIASAFGISTYWKDVKGTLVPRPKQAGMKDYLAYMNMLYKEGLLDSESPANKVENKKEKFSNGKAAAMLFNWNDWQMLPTVVKNFPNSSIAYIGALKGPNGQQEITARGVGYTQATAIPKNSKNAEHAMRFLDKFAETGVYKKIYVGEEGVHYKNTNGNLEPVKEKFEAERKISWTYLAVTPEKETAEVFNVAIKGEDPNVFDSFNKLYKSFPNGKKDPSDFLETPDSASKFMKSLQQFEDDMYIKFIAGAEPLSNYDAFVKNWDGQGGKQVEEDMNKAFKQN